MIDETLLEAEEKMEKAIEFARDEFANIRTGRANAAMFNKILVDYYGAPTPLQQLASFNIPEARTVIINPFDRGATAGIIKAIRDSDLGVNPTDDGQIIRINLPALTEDRRKDYVKMARSKAEDARITLRSLRHKAKDVMEKAKKDGDVGEDEAVRGEKELDSLTKRYVETIDELLAGKEKELLEV
ncbi:MAG: ribosome recycling factor [bacterium]|nr:ribosome recycling factor [bacterium]